MIKLNSIYKYLGRRLILSNVSLSVTRSEIVGITGPVGAGKSTLLFLISGLIEPDRGTVRVLGTPMQTMSGRILQRINYASSSQRLSGYATVIENLVTYARLYAIRFPKKRITELWNLFSLPPLLYKKKIYRLSSGENSLVNLIKALLNNPELLLLDEITAHMDPSFVKKVHALIRKRQKKTTTLLVSQNSEELSRLCTRLIILSRGAIVYDGKPLTAKNIQKYYEK